ncbi:cytochrome c oxidase subunit 6a [Tremella mesenterica]|uniref:Cytochrome c oxidase subunit 13, mitochondrial n=1 Tax=Tremella mesenterica TaxID=5217 RepID=A0A4Q1BCN7_TREME|nr:uncharacterized protein TREMEDRAFT_24629 [Tremella mesenterica DSM 1558]EIW72713.1 hypothetical protein TREMEDRAFT_24629 [Tremella mesenterica DSM 1558]RXK35536.1 cytochrome c oxidase subunit 6a [Tremella mesenterica]
MFRPAVSLARTSMKRTMATAAASGENEFVAKRAAVREHAAQTTELWRKISFYVCIPGIAVATLWTWKAESAHAEHKAHAKAEGHEHERVVYSYMNVRTKPFPWGNQSLFFNPEVNIPAGDAE